MPQKLNILPINKFSFKEIRSKNMIYVDKTQLIHELVSMPNYYFFSRPRRFGKSLLISTLEHLYKGNRQYFKNLWIENHWAWKEWPVIIIDFNSISNTDENALRRGFKSALERNAAKYEVELKEFDIKERFAELIFKINKKTNNNVVILVDEYDKPIIDHLSDDGQIIIGKKNRNIMKEFFGVLKDNQAGSLVEFLFITGVSKFSQVSIFSDLNNLTDITMSEKYSSLLGYTDEEIDIYFGEWLNKWHIDKNIKRDDIKKHLKQRYNGFRFSEKNVLVYNPISILNSLYEQNYQRNYWFKTATPTFLINLLIKRSFNIPEIEQTKLTETHFYSFDPEKIHMIALMFQTGYLTIKKIEKTNNSPTLFYFDYPNLEVKESFLELLMIAFAQIPDDKYSPDHFAILNDFQSNNFEIAITTMQKLFACIPILDYQNELFFHQFFYMMIRSACPESRTLCTDNKIFIIIETDNKILILNFSCLFSTHDLLMQIKEKEIYEKNKEIYKLAIHFNIKKRRISSWELEKPKIEPIKIPKELKSSLKRIKIFLASSNELKQERQEMALFIHRENNKLIHNGIYLEFVLWEELLHSFQGNRLQNYFNQKMFECDVVIVLFGSKIGEFTKEEFELAWKNLKQGKNPRFLFLYFKEIVSSLDRDALKQVFDMMDTIEKSKQLYKTFKDTKDLIYDFKNQLDLLLKEL